MKSFAALLLLCAIAIETTAHASPLLTCPRPSGSGHVVVCSTAESYTSSCLDDARDACKHHGYHLCSLGELDAAYHGGVRDSGWRLLDVRHRDARLTECGKYAGTDECYVEEGTPHIPNTPRPSASARALCCRV